jgi:hypothetical protein
MIDASRASPAQPLRKWLHRAAEVCNSSAMRRIFSVESKKKLWRPCREARAQGL